MQYLMNYLTRAQCMYLHAAAPIYEHSIMLKSSIRAGEHNIENQPTSWKFVINQHILIPFPVKYLKKHDRIYAVVNEYRLMYIKLDPLGLTVEMYIVWFFAQMLKH